METHNIYSDCGTIIHLHNHKLEGDENYEKKFYKIMKYTRGYASTEHVKRANN